MARYLRKYSEKCSRCGEVLESFYIGQYLQCSCGHIGLKGNLVFFNPSPDEAKKHKFKLKDRMKKQQLSKDLTAEYVDDRLVLTQKLSNDRERVMILVSSETKKLKEMLV